MWYCGQGKASRSPPFCPLAPEVSSHLICAPAPLQIQRRVGRSSVLANINLTHSLWLQKLENLYQNYPQKTRKKCQKPANSKKSLSSFSKGIVCIFNSTGFSTWSKRNGSISCVRRAKWLSSEKIVATFEMWLVQGTMKLHIFVGIKWLRVQYQSLALKSPDVPYWRGVNTSYLGRRVGTCWWYGCPVLLCRFNGMRPWSADSGALDASSHCGSLYWILDNPTYIYIYI